MEWTEEDRERLCLRQYYGGLCMRRFNDRKGVFYTEHSIKCDAAWEDTKALLEEANARVDDD